MTASNERDADALSDYRRAARRQRLRLLGVVALVIAVLGLIPIPFGAGYFGWRVMRYERVALYLVNTTGQAITVEIGGQREDVPLGEVASVPFRAGSAQLTVTGEDGVVLESLDVVTDNQDVFYNPLGGRCYGVLDASRLYQPGRASSDTPFELVAVVGETDRVYLIPRGTFLPPGSIPPETVPGGQGVYWIERGGCELLSAENAHLFTAQLMVRVETRRERRAEAEEQRRRAMGGQ